MSGSLRLRISLPAKYVPAEYQGGDGGRLGLERRGAAGRAGGLCVAAGSGLFVLELEDLKSRT